jgi:hypothetical protein
MHQCLKAALVMENWLVFGFCEADDVLIIIADKIVIHKLYFKLLLWILPGSDPVIQVDQQERTIPGIV